MINIKLHLFLSLRIKINDKAGIKSKIIYKCFKNIVLISSKVTILKYLLLVLYLLIINFYSSFFISQN